MSKRILSVILLICMLVNNLPVAALAEESTSGCSHVCDENCGYVKAVDCDKEECQPAEEGGEIVHVDGCAFNAGSPCNHKHNGDCGVECVHTGGTATCTAQAVCDTCGKGYGEKLAHTYGADGKCTCGDECEHNYAEGVCTVCSMAEPAPTCDCTVKCAEGVVNENCPVCSADGADLTNCIGQEPETEAPVITVSEWEWVDEAEIIEPTSGDAMLLKTADWDTVLSVLPAAILVNGEELEVTWEKGDFDETPGTYTLKAILPEGYALGDGTNTLSLTLEMGMGEELAEHVCPYGTFDNIVYETSTSLGINGGTTYYYLSDRTILDRSGERVLQIKGTVYLCLNGKELRASGYQIGQYDTLHLYDCSADGAGKIYCNTSGTNIKNNGTLYLHSGTIGNGTGNTGVENSTTGKFYMSGGSITGYKGSGVANKGLFTMTGGSIYNNKISNPTDKHMGGGVNNAAGATFKMENGFIYGNQSYFGGGVSNAGTFEMTGGTIGNSEAPNIAKDGGGGGVYNEGTFKMTGSADSESYGTISYNTASAQRGGGVYNSGTFEMSKGIISNNTCIQRGAGLFNNSNGSVKLSGNPVIQDNTLTNSTPSDWADYYEHKIPFIIDGELEGSQQIGLHAWGSRNPVTCGNTGVADNSGYFFSNNPEYKVAFNSTNQQIELQKLPTSNITPPTVDDNLGEVTVDMRSAVEGKTVTVTATSKQENKKPVVTVKGASDDSVKVTPGEDNTFTFIMPGENVSISVEFVDAYKVTTGTTDNEQGTVTVSPAYALQDEEVTIDPKPEDGYFVKSVQYIPQGGEPVFVNKDQDGAYSFKMPDKAVTVSVTFEEIKEYRIWIGDQQITSENLTINGTTGTATYTPAEGTTPATLTLDNFTYTGAGYTETEDFENVILYSGDRSGLTIKLVGQNTITCSAPEDTYGTAIATQGALTITDDTQDKTDSSLTVSTPVGDAVFSKGAVSISNVTVNATGAYDILSGKTMNFKNAFVTAHATANDSWSRAFNANGKVTILDSNVVAISESGVGFDTTGAYYGDDKTVEMTNSTVTVDAGHYGINSNYVYVTNSNLEIEAGTKAITTTHNTSTAVTLNNDHLVHAGNKTPGELVAEPDADTYANKYVKIAYLPPHVHCVCGEDDCTNTDHPKVTFSPWNGTGNFPCGNVYLTEDTVDGVVISDDGNYYICMNGQTVESELLLQKGTLTLTSCKDATLKGSVTVQKGTLNLYNVCVEDNDSYDDAVIEVSTLGATLNMYSGQAPSCYVSSTNSNFFMHGGEITDYVEVADKGTFTMSGGTVNNVALYSRDSRYPFVFNMSGGTVTGTVSSEDGRDWGTVNVSGGSAEKMSLSKNTTLNISGGSITNLSLSDGFTFNVTGPLSDNKKIGITATIPEADELPITVGYSDTDSSAYFDTLNDGCYIGYNSANKTLELKKKESINPTVTLDGWTYGEDANAPSVTGNTGNGTVTYSYKVQGADDSTYSNTVPTAAGDYTVKAEIAATDNYGSGTATADFTIAQKAVAEPKVSGTYTYTGNLHTVTLNGVESYMTVVSGNQGTNAGSYEAVVTLTNSNYRWADGSDGEIPWSIAKAPLTITAKGKAIAYGEAPANDGVTYSGFVNNETENVLGGALVYTYNYTQGDNVGSYDITPEGLTSDNYEITYLSGKLTVNKAASSATAPVAKDLTYTGSDLELVTPGEVTGGTVYYSLKENEGFSEDIPTGKNAGNYTVWYYVAGDGNHNNSAKASVSVTIAKKTLTVKANNKTITYGDEAANDGVTCNGFVGAESTADLKDTLTFSYSYQKGDEVGEYTITPAGYTSDNYAITFENGTLTVVAKPIAAEDVALSGSLTYNGIEQTQSVTVTEGITYSVEGNTATDAGTYQLTVKGTGNYTGEVKLSWSIAKAEINPTVSLGNWIYGESEKTPLVNGNSGDGKVTYSYKVKDAADETYSTNIPTAAGNYTVKAAVEETANYYGGTATADFTITKANAQVTAPAAKTLTYNGTEQNLVDAGITQHGTVKYSLSENGNYSQSVPTGMKAGTYTVWYYVEGDSNHSDSAKASVSVTIAKKTLTVKANNKTITYGEEAPDNDVTCTGFINGENETVLGGELRYSSDYTKGDKVGEYTITPAGYTSDNYAITFENGTLTVDKKEVTITAAAKTKVYGAEDPALTYTVSGLVSDDTVTDVKLTRKAGSNVGTYTIELETATVSDNYTLKYVSADFTITKAPLTVTAKNNTITYGDTPAGNGVTYSGFVGDDDATKLGGTLTYTYSYKQYDKAGEYTITPAGCTSGNYEITFENGKLTVGKKTITVAADAVTKVYGEEDPALTYKVSGLVNNDQLKGALSRETGENAGEYDITKGDLSGGDNYTVVYTGADFTIEKATPTISWETKEFTYDKQSHGEATVTLVNGETYTGNITYTCGGVEGLPTNAGTHTVEASIAAQDNYNKATATTSITINPKAVTPTVTLDAEFFTWDGTDKKPAVVVKDGDDVLSSDEYSVAYESNKEVGAGNVCITGKTGGNYDVAPANIKFLILPDASALEGVTTANVTSANTAAIDAIQAAMADKDITGVSKAAKDAWDALAARCTNLEKAIADAATGSEDITKDAEALLEDIKTSDLNKINEILNQYADIEDNLTAEQKAELADEIRELEKQKAAIEKTNADLKSVDDGTKALDNKTDLVYADKANIKALEDKIADMEKNNPYLSETDKQNLQTQKNTLATLKAEFVEADKVTDQLNALNTKAEPDDGNAVAAYEDAKKAYAELSDADKAKVNPAAPKRLEEMKAALTAYKIIKGDGTKHQLGSSQGLTIVSNGYYPHFRYVKVNGWEISSSDYTSASGSTIVTLKPEYLNRLMTGKYTITIGFGDADYIGEATANVQLYTDNGLPFTGDTIAMWIAILVISTGALVCVVVYAKKKSGKK